MSFNVSYFVYSLSSLSVRTGPFALTGTFFNVGESYFIVLNREFTKMQKVGRDDYMILFYKDIARCGM